MWIGGIISALIQIAFAGVSIWSLGVPNSSVVGSSTFLNDVLWIHQSTVLSPHFGGKLASQNLER